MQKTRFVRLATSIGVGRKIADLIDDCDRAMADMRQRNDDRGLRRLAAQRQSSLLTNWTALPRAPRSGLNSSKNYEYAYL